MSENHLIPDNVAKALSEAKYHRVNKQHQLNQLLDRLQITHPLLRNFYERFEGPLWSERLGIELLDPIEGHDTVESTTDFCRSHHQWPHNFIVLTKFSAGQVMVLDDIEDKVYEVDFEGGELLLGSGGLPVRWGSLANFFNECFAENR